MSYNGSGTFNINTAGQPVVTGTVISSTAFNALTADLGTGLSTAITKDGQTVATARIPFAAGINSSLVTDATNTTTGSIITAGGVGIAKALFVGTTANIAGTTTLAGVTATSITDSGLTSGRVTFASTAGLLADAAALAWDGTSLSATKFAGALNGTVGATTPATGAFTTLGATGVMTLSGVNQIHQLSGHNFVQGDATRTYLYGGTNGIQMRTSNNATALFEMTDAGQFSFSPAGTTTAVVSSTGLAVTGTLSATGNVTLGDAVGDVHTTNGLVQIGQGTFAARTGVKGVIAAGPTTGDIHCQLGDSGATWQWINAANSLAVMNLSNAGALSVSGTLEVTGVSSFGAGAIGAPSIYLSTDTTTGFYRIGANNVGFAVSGAKLLDLSSSGFTVRVASNNTLIVDSSNVQVAGTVGVTGALSVNGGVQYGGSVFAALSAGTICGQFANTANGQQTLSIWNKDTTGDNSFISFATETAIGNRGSISYNRAGGLTVYNTTSDYRLKKHIVDLPNALETVSKLKPRQFDWKETGNTTTGFIAHELAEVCPHAVTGEKDAVEMQQYEISPAVAATQDEEGNELTAAVEAVMGEREVPKYQGIDTSFLVATLTAAIQELKAIIDTQATRITALEAK